MATGEPRYKREWQAGVDAAEKAGAAVEALRDPVVGSLAAGATTPNSSMTPTVNDKLFPAMAAGDDAAAHAALPPADEYVRAPPAARRRSAYVQKR